MARKGRRVTRKRKGGVADIDSDIINQYNAIPAIDVKKGNKYKLYKLDDLVNSKTVTILERKRDDSTLIIEYEEDETGETGTFRQSESLTFVNSGTGDEFFGRFVEDNPGATEGPNEENPQGGRRKRKSRRLTRRR